MGSTALAASVPYPGKVSWKGQRSTPKNRKKKSIDCSDSKKHRKAFARAGQTVNKHFCTLKNCVVCRILCWPVRALATVCELSMARAMHMKG